MNANIDNTPADDTRFDRLVDGQLSEQQRHDLLAGLDDEPSGWRRCALAFLESQCWKQALGAIARESLPPAEPAAATRPPRSVWPGRLGTVSAMAASFMLAMWLGWWVQQRHVGQHGIPTGIGEIGEIAGNAVAKPWRMVAVSTPGQGGEPGPSFNLSAVERDNIDEQWLRSVPPAIPEEVLQALSRTGHEIQQRRELVSTPLEDGRRLVVPVDQVEVHYVGNGAY
ncbi:MAG: hypothetical protein KKE86_16105 [Planctomycetes bacterium]|nr:hypothetical protein [Planctomycetota bacterium]MBU4400839.1 hypothetical protein [Planctomycetota bacterium]MCG2682606.1 hypothetical protein [Planctomycetales bacterium]